MCQWKCVHLYYTTAVMVVWLESAIHKSAGFYWREYTYCLLMSQTFWLNEVNDVHLLSYPLRFSQLWPFQPGPFATCQPTLSPCFPVSIQLPLSNKARKNIFLKKRSRMNLHGQLLIVDLRAQSMRWEEDEKNTIFTQIQPSVEWCDRSTLHTVWAAFCRFWNLALTALIRVKY